MKPKKYKQTVKWFPKNWPLFDDWTALHSQPEWEGMGGKYQVGKHSIVSPTVSYPRQYLVSVMPPFSVHNVTAF